MELPGVAFSTRLMYKIVGMILGVRPGAATPVDGTSKDTQVLAGRRNVPVGHRRVLTFGTRVKRQVHLALLRCESASPAPCTPNMCLVYLKYGEDTSEWRPKLETS
jgi:hypothetical protein